MGGWKSVSRSGFAGVSFDDLFELIESAVLKSRNQESLELPMEQAPILFADEDGVAPHARDQDRPEAGTDLIHHELEFVLGIVARDPLHRHPRPPRFTYPEMSNSKHLKSSSQIPFSHRFRLASKFC